MKVPFAYSITRAEGGHRWLCLAITLVGLWGCANPASRSGTDLDAIIGDYIGSFASALTQEAADDLNFNPCDPTRQDCSEHHAPLSNVILRLGKTPDGKLSLAFYHAIGDLDAGTKLDLLGRGCGTRIDPSVAIFRGTPPDTPRFTVSFPLSVANKHCIGKLRPTPNHTVAVEIHSQDDPLRVVIDKALASTNYLYVVEDGIERRVKIDLKGSLGEGRTRQYRVCIEDDLGEFDRCVLVDRQLKQVLLPVPTPGGVGVNYTWWSELYPRLKRTRELYHLEQYVGEFEPMDR